MADDMKIYKSFANNLYAAQVLRNFAEVTNNEINSVNVI